MKRQTEKLKKKSYKQALNILVENPTDLSALHHFLKHTQKKPGALLKHAVNIVEKAIDASYGKKAFKDDPMPTLPYYVLHEAIRFYEDIQFNERSEQLKEKLNKFVESQSKYVQEEAKKDLDIRAMSELGWFSHIYGCDEETKTLSERMIQTAPEHHLTVTFAYWYLGMEAYDKNEYEKALPYLKTWFEKEPYDSSLDALADCLVKMRNVNEAKVLYQKNLEFLKGIKGYRKRHLVRKRIKFVRGILTELEAVEEGKKNSLTESCYPHGSIFSKTMLVDCAYRSLFPQGYPGSVLITQTKFTETV